MEAVELWHRRLPALPHKVDTKPLQGDETVFSFTIRETHVDSPQQCLTFRRKNSIKKI